MSDDKENLRKLAKLIKDNQEAIDKALADEGWKINYSHPAFKKAWREHLKFWRWLHNDQ